MSAASGDVTALHRRASFRQPPGEPVALRPPHVHMWRPRWKAGHFRIPPKDRPCPALHIRHSVALPERAGSVWPMFALFPLRI